MTTRPGWAAPVLAASALGFALGLVDSRPTWDDTGISAGALVVMCVVFGAIRPVPAWVSAVALAAWIPVLNMARTGNFSSLMVLPIAVVAAYLGRGLSRLLWRADAG